MAAAVAPASVVSVVPVMPVAVSLTRSRLAALAVSAAGPGGGARIGGAGGRGGGTRARGARSRARALSGGVGVGGGRGSGACGLGPFACVPAKQSLYRFYSDRDSRTGARERRVRFRRGHFSPLSVSSDFSSSLLDSSPEDSDEGGGWVCRWLCSRCASSRFVPTSDRPAARSRAFSFACGSFSMRQSAMVCGKAGRACSLVIVSERDFALKRIMHLIAVGRS